MIFERSFRLVVTGGSVTRRSKRSLCCLLVEVPWQINEYLNIKPQGSLFTAVIQKSI